MAQQSSISQLDAQQIIKRVYVEANDSVRIELADSAGIAIETSATDGDSIKSWAHDGAGTAITSTSGALDVNIKSGGATLEVNLDHANDDVLVYGNDGTTNRALKTDTSGELQVDVLSSALPTGASTLAEQQTQTTSLSAIQTAVQIMDDWDETDRAKVNPIVGQAGVQGGSGAITANTQRVVLATDQPVVQIKVSSQSRSDTFTGTGNGVTVDVSSNPLKYFSVQVKGTGAAPTSWDVRLEGSLDGTNFTQILQHNATDGSVVFNGANQFPARYFRSRVEALSLGSATNIVVTILGME